MEKQSLSAYIKVGKNEIHTSLEVYFFKEDDVMIAYCPALDISAYGDTVEESKKEFTSILFEHLEWCIKHDTLKDDLIKHGWKINAHSYAAPLATDMLIGNDTFRDIINHRDYQRVFLPQMFNRQYAQA